MNVIQFTKKLQQQAETATTILKNFKGFDDMAAQDDYIHSDSLNVKRRQHDLNKSNPVHQVLSGNLWSQAVKPIVKPTPSTQPASLPSAPHRPQAPLLAVVEEAMNQSPRYEPTQRQADEEQQLAQASSSDLEEDELVLQQAATRHRRASTSENKRNRFMDDLENRLSKENTPLPMLGSSRLDAGMKGSEETDQKPYSWMRGVLGRRRDEPHSTEMAPLARKGRKETTPVIEERFDVVTSSSVLHADELAQLNELESASPRMLTRIYTFVEEHPGEIFIIFVLICSVTFYLRGRVVSEIKH